MDHCFLCGISLPLDRQRRYKPSEELRAFVRARCVPTPVAYACIDEADGLPEESLVCIPCINWKRRASGRGQKQYLQVDQLVAYILQPGRMDLPEQRCVGRLLAALADPANPLGPRFPLPVQAIVARLETHDVPSIVRAWWELNGRTLFFRHPQTARLVRSLQKQDPSDE
jgi:hypothetical protein